MKRSVLLKIGVACGARGRRMRGGRPSAEVVPLYLDETQPIERRVEDALSRMTLEEKVAVLHAQSKFSSAGVPRLGIPLNCGVRTAPGIRPEVLWDEWDQAGWTNDSCTAFPALTCLAATWNPEMAALYGKSIGEEARYREGCAARPGRQYLPPAAQRPQLRIHGRGSLPFVAHGRSLCAGGAAGERRCGLCQALRAEQPGGAPPRCQCHRG